MGVLNWDKDFALEQAADDAELLEELIVIFKESFASDLSLIVEGFNAGSAKQVAGAAHSIKGAAASLGINGVFEVTKLIEQACSGGDVDFSEEKLAELQEMLDELRAL